ncbi:MULTISPECIES: TniQ family protein [unclassified Paenibacillus]|uniref:TniQ family protein n=1 Tax=unclassified Paenibacillus TaxID=185978 RepID=UPI0030F727CE
MNKLPLQPLPLRPLPYYDESLSGYLLRFSSMNFVDPKFLYRKLDLFSEKPQIKSYFIDWNYFNDRDLNFLTNITNIKAVDIVNMMIFKYKNRDIIFNGNHILQDDIEAVRAKICPCCLSENEYFRKIWLLSNVTVCPYHNVELMDSCSVCSEQLSWRKGNIFICSCGHRYKKSKAVFAANEAVNFSEYIYSKCDLYKENLTFSNKSDFLDCDLLTLNTILRFLRREITTGLSVEDKYKRGYISFSEYAEVQLNVIQILSSWPQGYKNFLNDLYLTKYSDLFLLDKSFIKFQRENGNLKPLIEEYHLYVKPIKEKRVREEEEQQKNQIKEFERMVGIIKDNERALSLKRKEQGLLLIKEVGKVLRCQEWHVKFWMKKGLLDNNKEDGLGAIVTLESFKKFKRTYITLKEIQKKLKTSYTQLSKQGILPVSGLKVDGGRMYLYRKKDIKVLLK